MTMLHTYLGEFFLFPIILPPGWSDKNIKLSTGQLVHKITLGSLKNYGKKVNIKYDSKMP